MSEKIVCFVFAAVIFFVGLLLVADVDAWAAIGVVAMIWGNNLSRDTASRKG